MPFITEEIWQKLKQRLDINADTIMLQPFPKAVANSTKPSIKETISLIKKMITGVRTIRSEMDIKPSRNLPLLIGKANSKQKNLITENQSLLLTLAKLESFTWLENETPPPAATALADNIELFIPLAGLIDKTKEITRIEKRISKLQNELQRSQQKLNNENYTSNAPANVVAAERQKVTNAQIALAKLQQHANNIRHL